MDLDLRIKPKQSGVRIVHEKIRNDWYLVPDIRRPMLTNAAGPNCGPCGRRGIVTKHLCKTYHLWIKDDGSIIVSSTIWEKLRSMGGAGFTLSNEVTRPPTQTIVIPKTVAMLRAAIGQTKVHDVGR